MSNLPRRTNSTNPRPGIPIFPIPIRTSTNGTANRSNNIPQRTYTQRTTSNNVGSTPQRTYTQRTTGNNVSQPPQRSNTMPQRSNTQRTNPWQSQPRQHRQSNNFSQSRRPSAGVGPGPSNPRPTSNAQSTRPGVSRSNTTTAGGAQSAREIPQESRAATRKQINQTLSIAMITNPANPLPFPLPVPLGITMLLMGNASAGNRASTQ